MLTPTPELKGRTHRRRLSLRRAAVPSGITVHLDRGYDGAATRTLLTDLGFVGEIARKGVPAPIQVGQRWVVERTTAWTNAHKTLVWCPERRSAVIACSTVIIIVGRLVREGWIRYRWEGRPRRKP